VGRSDDDSGVVPPGDVIVLGADLPYADGSEAVILDILRRSVDVSSRSDELAAHIVDWPTRYHLSRLRSNLFAPLAVESGMRVLEIGCGTGVNLRAMAERGAQVVGVEGSLARARCARERCRDLPDVTIYAGDVDDLPDIGTFDLVLLIGVLEYSTAGSGGARGPHDLLQKAAAFAGPAGSVVVAIENQLGLKYLLGYREDHHGVPWVGIEGYRDAAGARTWTRSTLSSLLSKAGLGHQRWFFPFPDYKLPTFIADEELFATDGGRQLATTFNSQPVLDHSAQPVVAADVAAVFESVVDAGIACDLANSFLVVASQVDPSSRLHDGLAWMSTQERAAMFMVDRVIRTTSTVEQTRGPRPDEPSDDGWLTNIGHGTLPIVAGGVTLGSQMLTAVMTGDDDTARAVWSVYRAAVTEWFGSDDDLLDGGAVDCTLSNVIDDGQPVFIDREWRVHERISRDIVELRALYDIGLRTVRRTGSLGSVGDVIGSIASIVGVALTDELIDRFCEFEARFQTHVHGGRTTSPDDVRTSMGMTVSDLVDFSTLSELTSHIRSLEQHAAGLEQLAAGLDQHAAGLEQHAAGLERALQAERAELSRVSERIAQVERVLDDAHMTANSAIAERDAVLHSRSFRLGNLLLRPFAAVLRR